MPQLTVLIAEPSKTGRHIFTQLMSRIGVSVTFTTSARETFTEAKKNCFDLICLSQKLPDDEGVNVCAKIRMMNGYKTTNVLLVTPQKSSINYDHAFSNGVTQLIGRHELHRVVHAVELMLERTKPIKGRVLVVEDSRSQAEYLSALLSSMGLVVDIVCSGEQAIEPLSTICYNLALVDVVLAGNMTGVELVDHIRTLSEPYNHVRVLAMSAYEDPSRRIKLFNLGIDDFINKPVVKEELIARVRGLLSQHYSAATVKENERLSHSLGQLLDNSPDAIGRFDLNGKLLFMNPQMARALGVNATDEIGKHFSQLGFNNETQIIYQQAIEQLLRRKKSISYQTSGRTNIDYDIQFTPEMVNEQVVSFISSSRDITQSILLQKQLLASKQQVEQASEAKTRFLATMSHELRTPLNAISGYGQLMRQKLKNNHRFDPVEFDQYLELIGENANNLTTLIDDVLDLSQIEAGKLSAHLQSVNIVHFVEGIKSGFLRECEQRDIALIIDTSHLCVTQVVIDKVKTLTMINNLIDNAIKFSHQGGSVLVAVVVEDNQFKVKVEDQGIGFPAAFDDKLFSVFEQVDNSKTREHGGIGLGLSIVKNFASFLGGSIKIDGVEGQGTKCLLILPLGLDETKNDHGQQKQQTFEHQNQQDHRFSGQKILVVEDSVVNQQLMVACLTNYGLQVKIAENGLIGIEQTRQWRPDLVLMDMHMPKMDGLEATINIKAIDELKHIPIFGLSADVQKDYIAKAHQCGMSEYLTKPVDFGLLTHLLEQYLKAPPVPDESVEQTTEQTVEQNEAKEPAMNEVSVLNIEKGVSFAANNSGLFRQLLGTFVSQYEASAQQLDDMNAQGKHDDAMKLAHTMKGVCATLGMDSLSEIAKKMQFAFDHNQLDDIDSQISEFKQLLMIAIKEANEYCAS